MYDPTIPANLVPMTTKVHFKSSTAQTKDPSMSSHTSQSKILVSTRWKGTSLLITQNDTMHVQSYKETTTADEPRLSALHS